MGINTPFIVVLQKMRSARHPLMVSEGPARWDGKGRVGTKLTGVSTEELRRILVDGSATVFDARPFMEFASGHIPGAVNVSAKAGMPMSLYVSDVAEIERVLHGDKGAAIVLYCNGPFCGKSSRLAEELIQAGFTNIRRYQLGAPVWRALGGVMQIEPAGFQYVREGDHTARTYDTRPAADYSAGTLPGAIHLLVAWAEQSNIKTATLGQKRHGEQFSTVPIRRTAD